MKTVFFVVVVFVLVTLFAQGALLVHKQRLATGFHGNKLCTSVRKCEFVDKTVADGKKCVKYDAPEGCVYKTRTKQVCVKHAKVCRKTDSGSCEVCSQRCTKYGAKTDKVCIERKPLKRCVLFQNLYKTIKVRKCHTEKECDCEKVNCKEEKENLKEEECCVKWGTKRTCDKYEYEYVPFCVKTAFKCKKTNDEQCEVCDKTCVQFGKKKREPARKVCRRYKVEKVCLRKKKKTTYSVRRTCDCYFQKRCLKKLLCGKYSCKETEKCGPVICKVVQTCDENGKCSEWAKKCPKFEDKCYFMKYCNDGRCRYTKKCGIVPHLQEPACVPAQKCRKESVRVKTGTKCAKYKTKTKCALTKTVVASHKCVRQELKCRATDSGNCQICSNQCVQYATTTKKVCAKTVRKRVCVKHADVFGSKMVRKCKKFKTCGTVKRKLDLQRFMKKNKK